jgi:hypothetical protein
LYTWMLAGLLHAHIRRRDWRLCGHVIRIVPKVQGSIAPEFLGIVERPNALSSPLLLVRCEFVTGYSHLGGSGLRTPPVSDPFRRIRSNHSAESTYH